MANTAFIPMERVRTDLWKRYLELEKLRFEAMGKEDIKGGAGNSDPNLDNVSDSIKWFVENLLEGMYPLLYKFYREKRERKEARKEESIRRDLYGCSSDNLYHVFYPKDRKITKDVINLVCFYLYNQSYEACIFEGILPDARLAEFNALDSRFKVYQNRIERNTQPNISEENYNIRITSCTWEEIEQLKKIYPELEQYREFNLAKLKSRFEYNPNIFYGMKDTQTDRLIGFYILYSITKKLAELIEDEEMISAEYFDDADLVKNIMDASALYVSLVWAEDKGRARGLLHHYVLINCIDQIKSNKQILTIYTKPTTPFGRLIASKYQFMPLKNSKGKSLIQYRSRNAILYAQSDYNMPS